jgi:hypothetical protein
MFFFPLYLGWEKMAGVINGKGALTWKLPLPPLSPTDIEPVSARLDPGEEAARYTYIHAYIYIHTYIHTYVHGRYHFFVCPIQTRSCLQDSTQPRSYC